MIPNALTNHHAANPSPPTLLKFLFLSFFRCRNSSEKSRKKLSGKSGPNRTISEGSNAVFGTSRFCFFFSFFFVLGVKRNFVVGKNPRRRTPPSWVVLLGLLLGKNFEKKKEKEKHFKKKQ